VYQDQDLTATSVTSGSTGDIRKRRLSGITPARLDFHCEPSSVLASAPVQTH